MKLKTNLFERIKQHFVDDGGDIHWWIDDDYLEEFKEIYSDQFKDGDIKITDTREISSKKWNEWWIGGIWGEYEGILVDENCPTCGHLLVDPEKTDRDDNPLPACRYCTDCDYVNDDLKAHHEAELKFWEDLSNKPPENRIRLEGETIFEFTKRVGLQMDKRTDYQIKNDNYYTNCVICKRDIPADDYYIGQDSGFAMITFSHEDCTNGGPCVGTPFKKEAKEEWNNLLD